MVVERVRGASIELPPAEIEALREPATGNYLLDVFREPHDGQT